MKLKDFPTVSLAEKEPVTDVVQILEYQLNLPAFDKSLTVLASNKPVNVAALSGIFVAGAAASTAVLLFEQPVSAAPDPNVAAVVETITDTIPLLTGIAMLVLSAGLAPWAARTCLSWLSSILRGAL